MMLTILIVFLIEQFRQRNFFSDFRGRFYARKVVQFTFLLINCYNSLLIQLNQIDKFTILVFNLSSNIVFEEDNFSFPSILPFTFNGL